MAIRKTKGVLLGVVALLLAGAVADVWILKEDLLEKFGGQFLNEAKTDAFFQAKRGVQSSGQQRLELERGAIQEVRLHAGEQAITVKRSAGSKIQLVYTVTAYGDSQEAADRARAAVQVGQSVDQNRLTFQASAGGKTIDANDLRLSYELLVPDHIKISIASENGSVQIQGVLGDVEAESKSGFMEIVGVTGAVKALTSYGSLYLADISGDVVLTNRGSDATISDVRGALQLIGDSGRSQAAQVKGPVTARTEYGTLLLRDVSGEVELNSRHTNLQLEQIRNTMRLHVRGGNLAVFLPESEGYTLQAAVENGRLQTHLPVTRSEEQGVERIGGKFGNGSRAIVLDAVATDIQLYTEN